MKNFIKIANGQGFWGDCIDAPKILIKNSDINYLTLDYLAEVTMSIMQKQKNKNNKYGYATDFIDLIDECADEIIDKNIKIITNAGGVNPLECAKKIAEVHQRHIDDIIRITSQTAQGFFSI